MKLKWLSALVVVTSLVFVFTHEGIRGVLFEQVSRLGLDANLGMAKQAKTEDEEHAGQENEHSAGGEHHSAKPAHGDHHGHHPRHKIIATSPRVQDITITESYVCQIHSRRHIEIRALEEGYLQDVLVNEGQTVKEGDLMFRVIPTLYQANLDADLAEAQLAQVEYDNTRKLVDQNIVSIQELKLAEAKLAKAKARVERARAELDFASIKAPFDGIVDRLEEQKGSLLEEGATLTRLSDNEVMWVYFNVPEVRYLEYQEALNSNSGQDNLDIELMLANHKLFREKGHIGAIEAEFNNETGNIAFRADFPNDSRLLRHGQTGTILIHHDDHDALVIPQRAVFEILDKTYVYVLDDQQVVHQREISIDHEQDDIFVIRDGLQPGEKIILEGLRQVRDGEHVEFEYQAPDQVLANLKYHAE